MKIIHLLEGDQRQNRATVSHIRALAAALSDLGIDSLIVEVGDSCRNSAADSTLTIDSFADVDRTEALRAFVAGDHEVVLHTHSGDSSAVTFACKRVCTIQTTRFLQDVSHRRTAFWNELLQRQDFVIAPSREIVEKLLRIGVSTHCVAFVPYGVDHEIFRPDPAVRQEWRSRLDIPSGAIVALCPQPWTPESGVLDFAHSLRYLEAALDELGPAVVVVMTGSDRPIDDQYVESVRLALQESQLGRMAVRLGSMPYQDLACALQMADVCVIPSLKEASGLTALEALATGVPVVATRAGGLCDVVSHAEQGLLVDQGNPLGMANALTNLILDRDRRQILAEQAIQTAKNFSWLHVARQLLPYYQQVFVTEGNGFR